MNKEHDRELCHAITGSYHCDKCGACIGYIGCPDCDPNYEKNLALEMGFETGEESSEVKTVKQIFMIETTKGTDEQELNMILDGEFINDEENEVVQIREITNEVVEK